MIRKLHDHAPRIHPSAFVSERAYVVGRVEIGEGSSVWPGAVVRGDNAAVALGRYVNMQDNVIVHADQDALYGDYITMGHGAICHARKVGSHVLIGSGAVVNDGVEIGDYCIVASGAVVLENTVIPPRSLVVGIPAQVRGEVQQRHLDLIELRTNEYVRKAALYKSSGLGDEIP